MGYDIVIKGRIVNHDEDFHGYVGIADDRIKKITKTKLHESKILRLDDGCLVFPGFIDAHFHFREDGSHEWDYKEDFASGSRAAIHGGITGAADMPNTPRPALILERIIEKKILAKQKSKIDILFYSGVSTDNILNLGKMANEVAGYKIFTCESTGGLYLPYEYVPLAAKQIPTDKKILFHCEDEDINKKRKASVGFYSNPERFCDTRPIESELFAIKKVLSYNIPNTHICHVSTPMSFELVRKSGLHPSCEVTIHHLYFNRRAMNEKGTLAQCNPPLRAEIDRATLLRSYGRGEIQQLVSDHAGHSLEEKTFSLHKAPSGIAGADNFGNVVSWLIADQDVDPKIIASTCSYFPAKFLNLGDRGEIREGKKANLTILNLHKPEKVTSESLYTKCGTNPYVGREFPGRVEYTIINGEILMEDGKVLV